MSGEFRHSRGVLCWPCPMHIDINTLKSSLSVLCVGGFTLGPSRFHSRSHVAVAELVIMLCAHIRPIRRARHIASMSIQPQPPCLFGFCRLDIGTRNVAPIHTYHAIVVVNCRVHVVVAGNTWAICHIFAGRYACTNESVERGLSPARMYPFPGLSPCLLRSPSSCSLSAQWCS